MLHRIDRHSAGGVYELHLASTSMRICLNSNSVDGIELMDTSFTPQWQWYIRLIYIPNAEYKKKSERRASNTLAHNKITMCRLCRIYGLFRVHLRLHTMWCITRRNAMTLHCWTHININYANRSNGIVFPTQLILRPSMARKCRHWDLSQMNFCAR